jgi:ferric-dicitrate binding protein FerR (iron transport regulator)
LYPTEFCGKTREVILYGEGYFEVSKNKDLPFIVKTTSMDVRVLGTEFNLSAYAEDNVVQTVLKEGSVAIRKKDHGLFDKDLIIKPNEMASFNKTTNNTNIYKVDADYYRLWTKGLISFEDADFIRVIKKVERFYNVSIRFEESRKETIRISGKLDLKQSRREVMEYLAKVSISKIEQESENKYIIK